MESLDGLVLSLCQMNVLSGRPDANARYIIGEIREAARRGTDIIVFPEMATTGYLVGDLLEDAWFVDEVTRLNREIIEATRGGPVAVFGTVSVSPDRGEDGRVRLHNTAIVADGGRLLGQTIKTLQPNYRFFNDAKHLSSLRQIAEAAGNLVVDYLWPVRVATHNGTIALGVTICEDIWDADYPHHPARTLVERGAELLVNLSASPWTRRKNAKRHRVVRGLLEKCNVPLVYVNNTGAQNTGKNILAFDGSSTVYGRDGNIVFEVLPYTDGTFDMTMRSGAPTLPERLEDDTAAAYEALRTATRHVLELLPSQRRTVVIGVSGGIDSATALAHVVDVLGPDRVVAVNMPFVFSDPTVQSYATAVAHSLGVRLEIIPIGGIVEAIASASGVSPGTLAYENIQARARMEILAAKAQLLGGVFSCNANKVEIAFGYGTLYGDTAGFYAPLGDLVKREVRQFADYLNRVVFGREVIPASCIHQPPTAELTAHQMDPFDYGDLDARGYHDEMVRAFTEFRKNPEWFLERYVSGKLEAELGLEAGRMRLRFPTAHVFVDDLKRSWNRFSSAYFKRVQAPPIPVVSRRAFGRDLEEALLMPYTTKRFRYLEHMLLGNAADKRIAVYGGSFNPPGRHHRAISERLRSVFDRVIIVPSGARESKPGIFRVPAEHRKAMVALAFASVANVEFDYTDLDQGIFTPTVDLESRYRKRWPEAEIWFVVGADIVRGGRDGDSEIQRQWVSGRKVWEELHIAVITHNACAVESADLPPKAEVIEMGETIGRSTMIRDAFESGRTPAEFLDPAVAGYIAAYGLYGASHETAPHERSAT